MDNSPNGQNVEVTDDQFANKLIGAAIVFVVGFLCFEFLLSRRADATSSALKGNHQRQVDLRASSDGSLVATGKILYFANVPDTPHAEILDFKESRRTEYGQTVGPAVRIKFLGKNREAWVPMTAIKKYYIVR